MNTVIEFDIKAFEDFITENIVDVDKIKSAIKQYDEASSFLNKLEAIFMIIKALVETLQWKRIGGWTADEAIDFGSKAVDKLLKFEGSIMGIIPIGAILEAYDDTIAKLLLKMVYEAVRRRDEQTKKEFNKKIKAMFKKK